MYKYLAVVILSAKNMYICTGYIFFVGCVCLCGHHITFQVGLLIKDGSN